MITISDGLKHLYVPKLNEVGHNVTLTLNEWLASGSDYIIYQDLLNNNFSIQTYNINDFLKPYAFEINRLSCASLESIKDIEPIRRQPKFVGWNLTKFYYSAFFSAHSILKVTGNSISNIDSKSLDGVRARTRIYSFKYENINSGLYCIEFLANNCFRFYKNPLYNNSHEGLWRCFYDFLTSSRDSVYNHLPQEEAQNIVDKIDELIVALCEWSSINGNWLSRIRNLVNYSQKFGSWFPYKDYKNDYDRIYDYTKLHLENPLSIDLKSSKGREITYFVKTCQLINSINLDLLNDIASRHPNNKSFVANGVHKFMKLYP